MPQRTETQTEAKLGHYPLDGALEKAHDCWY